MRIRDSALQNGLCSATFGRSVKGILEEYPSSTYPVAALQGPRTPSPGKWPARRGQGSETFSWLTGVDEGGVTKEPSRVSNVWILGSLVIMTP